MRQIVEEWENLYVVNYEIIGRMVVIIREILDVIV